MWLYVHTSIGRANSEIMWVLEFNAVAPAETSENGAQWTSNKRHHLIGVHYLSIWVHI